MRKEEIKRQLISRIESLDDKELLEDILRLIQSDEDEESMRVDPLCPEHIRELSKRKKEMVEGNFIDADEADMEIDQWLSQFDQ